MLKKRLDWKDKVSFKIHDVTTWLTKITIHILPNISRSKDKQTMKLGQLAEYIRETFFFKNYAESNAGRLVPNLFLFFKKA